LIITLDRQCAAGSGDSRQLIASIAIINKRIVILIINIIIIIVFARHAIILL